MSIQYITQHGSEAPLRAVAVALHLTLARYARYQPRERSPFGLLDSTTRGIHWNGAHAESTPLTLGTASGVLIAAEIRGYFAATLLLCAGLEPLAGDRPEDGHMRMEARHFCPAWKLERRGMQWVLRARSRISEAELLRLLKRYGQAPFRRAVVACSISRPSHWIDRHQFDGIRFPPELVHFPQHPICPDLTT